MFHKKILRHFLALALIPLLSACSSGGPEGSLPSSGETETLPPASSETVGIPETETVPAAPTETALTDEEMQILRERRQKVLDRMASFVNLYWTPAETFQYRSDTRDFTFEKGLVYRGCPYAYGIGGRETFLDYAADRDEKGIYTVSDIPADSGSARWLFSDCSGTLWQAWSCVASSVSDRVATNMMTPSNGFLRVGDYESEESVYSDTVKTCSDNGTQRMYRAYARLKPGDAVVYRSAKGVGHVAMVKEIMVLKDAKGEPAENSYVILMEQTSVNSNRNKTAVFDETLGQTVYVVGNTDHRVDFAYLYRNGFLPITCRELIDPSAPVTEQMVTDPIAPETVGIDNLFEGLLKTPFGISAVRIVITDLSGAAVQECVYYNSSGGLRTMNMGRLAIMPCSGERVDPAMLPAGQYHCRCEARMCSGEVVLFRDFDFVR